ncbi:MAG: alpha/beta hydrolase family esterase [Aggregatilineales bacterium]
MLQKYTRLCIFLLLCLSVFPAIAQDTGSQSHTLMVDEQERSYQLYLPSGYDGETPLPLVLALHPIVSSGAGFQALTGFDTFAEERDFIVAYPNSLGFAWDDGRIDAGFLNKVTDKDDLAFIETLLSDLQENYAIDADRIHLTGFHNGGTMGYRLLCEMPETFASFAIVGALPWTYQLQDCQETEAPVNLLLMHGSADFAYPAEGREIPIDETRSERSLSLSDTVLLWALYAGCDVENSENFRQLALFNDCREDSSMAVQNMPGTGNSWLRNDKDYILNQSGLDVTAIVTAYFMGDETWTEMANVDTFAGVPRTYHVYVPSTYNPAIPTPVVYVLHGRPGNGLGMAFITEMSFTAEREGFITVFPDGLDQGWNYTNGIPVYGTNALDDVQFLDNLHHDLSLTLNIDPSRRYVTGFSNGGFMTQRLACDVPTDYTAYAVVGASIFFGMTPLCEEQPPVPMMFIHGTQDVSVPWNGQLGEIAGEEIYLTAPVSNMLTFWAEHNGCMNATNTVDLPQSGDSPETSVRLLQAEECADNATLRFYGIINGGHNWSGVPGVIGDEIAGNVNMDINASDIIWDFFKEYENDNMTDE